MTFVWLTPLIILVLFLTVILFQGSIANRASSPDEDRKPGATKHDQDNYE